MPKIDQTKKKNSVDEKNEITFCALCVSTNRKACLIDVKENVIIRIWRVDKNISLTVKK